jgi:antitoxin CptB
LKRRRGNGVWIIAMNDNQPDSMDLRLRRARYRADHRGTKEADLVVGGFFARHHENWGDAELAWFEVLLQEQDVDILAWAFGTATPPDTLAGELMESLKKLDYVDVLK